MGTTVRFLRELDARNAPVQFDEREEETELRQTGLRRSDENLTNCHREAKVTAPLLDSTQFPAHGRTNKGREVVQTPGCSTYARYGAPRRRSMLSQLQLVNL